MEHKLKEQLKLLLMKAKIADYDNALFLMTKLLINQTSNDRIKKEAVNKKYGSMIRELLAEISSMDNEKHKEEHKEEQANLHPVIKKRNSLFMRTKINKLNDFVEGILKPLKERFDAWDEEVFDVLKDNLRFAKDIIVLYTKMSNWYDIENFIYEYFKYVWDNPLSIDKPILRLTEQEKEEIELFYQQEVPKPEEEDEEKPKEGKSNHRLIIYFITDTNFRDNYASIMKDFAEDWITKHRSLLGADAISKEFFQVHRDKFRKELHPEDRSDLLRAISNRIETYLKAKNIQDLYDENKDSIRKSIQNIIEVIVKDTSRHKTYSSMTGIELIGRIYDLLCMDRSVGGIVSGVPDPVKKDIQQIIKKKFKKHEIFHMLR